MAWMTKGLFRYLTDVKELDDIQLGCLDVRLSIGTKKKRAKLKAQCVERKWIRLEPRDDVWVDTIYLTTLGFRAWRREEARRGYE